MKDPSLPGFKWTSKIPKAGSQEFRIEDAAAELLVDAELICLDDTKSVSAEIRLASEQNSDLSIDDQRVLIGSRAQHVERVIKAIPLTDTRNRADQIRGSR